MLDETPKQRKHEKMKSVSINILFKDPKTTRLKTLAVSMSVALLKDCCLRLRKHKRINYINN